MDTERASSGADQLRLLARRIYPDELAGAIGKSLVVGPAQQAVVTRSGGAAMLPAGRHRVGWAWGGLPNDIVVVDARPLTLNPIVGGVFSGDGKLMEAELLLSVHVADARRLAQALGDDDRLTSDLLSARLGVALQDALNHAAGQYAAADLQGSQVDHTPPACSTPWGWRCSVCKACASVPLRRRWREQRRSPSCA